MNARLIMLDDITPAYLKDPKLHGNHGIFLIMRNAGFVSSTVCHTSVRQDYMISPYLS